MTIKVVNQYSVDRARDWIRGSLQAHGEQCILLPIWHPERDTTQPRCPRCTDDIYTGGKASCSICYGTGFTGGPQQARRVWALFSDTRHPEQYTARGVWSADAREIQTEAFPELREHDYVARVKNWDLTGTVPQDVYAIYAIGEVNQDSLRTGARFGQYHDDVVGQRAPVTKLASNIKIYDYPIVGRAFPEFTWAHTGEVVQTVVQPDQRVIFFTPEQGTRHAVTLGDGVSTDFTVIHNLDTKDLTVTVWDLSTDEIVDPDVTSVDDNTIHVHFGETPTSDQYRVVIKA